MNSKTAIVAAFVILIFIIERAWPAAPNAKNLPRVAKNYALAMFNFILSPLIVIPLSMWAANAAPHWRPVFWTGWTGLVFDLLVLDFWIYWWHRANHIVPLLWRFHEIHHLDENLDSTSAVRFHFGEVLLSSVVRAAVIFILAVPMPSVIVFETVLLLAVIFHHSNLRLPSAFERTLSMIIVTPSIHWIHHHAKRADTDSSYSTGLSIWDRLFGSSSSTVRSASLPIGVEQQRDVPLFDLLTRPVKKRE